MATAILINSPTDFGKTIGTIETRQIILADIPSETESPFRQAMREIFDDLQYIDETERGLVSTYLNQIVTPLKKNTLAGFYHICCYDYRDNVPRTKQSN